MSAPDAVDNVPDWVRDILQPKPQPRPVSQDVVVIHSDQTVYGVEG